MRLELPERKKLVFERVIPIRWGDMDAMGHLNNTSYFRYLETCRIDWMQSMRRPGGAAAKRAGAGERLLQLLSPDQVSGRRAGAHVCERPNANGL